MDVLTKIYFLEKDNIPFYIGKTSCSLRQRLSNHHKFQNGVNIVLLDIVLTKDWKFWEKHYISLFKSWNFKLENKNSGGGGVTHHSIKTKKLISKTHTGLSKPMKENTKKLISEIHKSERILTKNWKTNISKSLIGRKISENWKRKISENTKNTKGKPVLQYDLQENFIKEWITASEAEENTRTDKKRTSRNIADCCLKKQKTAYGYKWKHK